MSARSAVTLSSENGPSRFRPSLESCPAASGAQRPDNAPRRPSPATPARQSAAGRR
jgi:hypothetical protein